MNHSFYAQLFSSHPTIAFHVQWSHVTLCVKLNSWTVAYIKMQVETLIREKRKPGSGYAPKGPADRNTAHARVPLNNGWDGPCNGAVWSECSRKHRRYEHTCRNQRQVMWIVVWGFACFMVMGGFIQRLDNGYFSRLWGVLSRHILI